MSFGFSIGDIVLLSQLAYKLYSSVTAGRKAASQDLKELEDVLFSLRCALDHLGDVAEDVLAKAQNRHGGAHFGENLGRMMASCGSTLQELDNVTRKYREVGIDEDEKDSDVAGKKVKKRTLARVKVNWKKVRWDQEKESLQQYREKLRSHTDAINIILTSVIWANTNSAKSSSKSNHEKTHSLLDQVLKNPQADAPLRQMIQEIHNMLIQPKPQAQARKTVPLRTRALANAGFKKPSPSFGPGVFAMMNTASFTPAGRAVPAGALGGGISHGLAQMCTADEGADTVHAYHAEAVPDHSPTDHRNKVPFSIIALNNERRALGGREYEAFKKRSSRPAKLDFLAISTPTVHQLHAGLAHIFHPLPHSGSSSSQDQAQTRASEMVRWMEGFRHFVQGGGGNGEKTKASVDLMVALNENVEMCSRPIRDLFYQAADRAELPDVLERLQGSSKSVRVMKEIEEFQDAREDWLEK